MFYNKNKDKILKDETFKSPTAEYRGAPFWAWNNKLERKELLEQIEILKQMGMGGFHIHCRTGLDTEYMGEEYLQLVKDCNEKAKQENMLCWLYDEDRWPSGYAGGLVTKDEKYRARFLVFTPFKKDKKEETGFVFDSRASVASYGGGNLLATYKINLEDGYLTSYQRLGKDDLIPEGDDIWYAYLENAQDSPWFNNQAYVNTLDRKAIERFIEVTHEKYYELLKEDFGGSIPAIFTDEPQFSPKSCLNFAGERKDVILPFTDDIEETYQAQYGQSLMEHLPELFWELSDGSVSQVRYRYHDHISELFTSAFADTIGKWCENHNIMLAGHMMMEPTLQSQTGSLGEAMRSYRSFQLPGIDLLCDRLEYTTAKQAQSASHQYGREGVMSELYGVTNWDFDFRKHKVQGDWQAALGITTRVQHLSLVSMAGEAKRDYPASISYQAPWYEKYSYIEDHFARLNTALTRGKAHVKVGMIHPIESYWLHFGPNEQTGAKRKQLDENFQNITSWLLFGLIDFDYISESLLPELSEVEKTPVMHVGKMDYDVIVIPGCETLRKTTFLRLEAFQRAGGKIVFAGQVPAMLDAKVSSEVQELAERCLKVPFDKNSILESLEEFRTVDIRVSGGKMENIVLREFNQFSPLGERTGNLFYQMRDDGDNKWLFICNAFYSKGSDNPATQQVKINIKGEYTPIVYDTLKGEKDEIAFDYENGNTLLEYELSYHDSLLLYLNKGKGQPIAAKKSELMLVQSIRIRDAVPVTLSEPNVLLLDMAEYSYDHGQWQEKDEILRIDNKFRKELGYPLRRAALAQPWTDRSNNDKAHCLSLRFTIHSRIQVEDAILALENAAEVEIVLNGKTIEKNISGWFVDKSIKKVSVGTLPAGISNLVLHIPFYRKCNVEWCYLLGNFGVNVAGEHTEIVPPVTKLYFGDWTKQGLPFFAGNVTYHINTNLKAGKVRMRATKYRAELLSASLDGKEKGNLVFAPYELELGEINEGEHNIQITSFGNRINAFGAVHNCDELTTWFGPDVWRSEHDRWAYEYQLKQTGILISPIIDVYSK